jgi:hypothetical protein
MDEGIAGDRELAALGVEAEDEAAGLLLRRGVAFVRQDDAVGRVGEPDGAVRLDDDVVGRVQPLALEAVHEAMAGAIRLRPGDPPVAVLAVDDTALAVERVAVGVVVRLAPDHPSRALGPADRPVRPHVAVHHRLLAGQPHGTLGPDATLGQASERRIWFDQACGCRVEDDDGAREAFAHRGERQRFAVGH